MDKVLIKMTANEIMDPEVIFVGHQDRAEALLFKAIYNAEGGSYKKVETEHGIHITVNETQIEIQGRKNVPVVKEVHYFLQNAKMD